MLKCRDNVHGFFDSDDIGRDLHKNIADFDLEDKPGVINDITSSMICASLTTGNMNWRKVKFNLQRVQDNLNLSIDHLVKYCEKRIQDVRLTDGNCQHCVNKK
jgi:hypothetical protein